MNTAASHPRGHAIVIGGSMAGLMTARVLAGRFDQVTLIERDLLPEAPAARKGVPQGQHVHALLKRGEEILESLFPGVMETLIADGAVPMDMGQMRWHHCGVWKTNFNSPLRTTALTRPFLEAEVRRRVRALPNVRFLDGCEVLRLLTAEGAEARVVGVQLRHRESGTEEPLQAALVADTAGRGSHTPRWLEELGLGRPEESQIKIQVGYATLVLRRPPRGPQDAPHRPIYIVGDAPQSRRAGVMMPIEGGRWMATLVGMLGDHPPTDLAGFLAFARSLPADDLHQALREAEPVGEIVAYKFPANLRRHYERLPRFPDGLVVLGDSACSFNPFYGQGMTLAALGATALDDCLREAAPHLGGLSRRFQRALARLTDAPWEMTTGEDLRFPEVAGRRPLGFALMQGYLRRLHLLTATDAQVLAAFHQVMHLLQPPTTLLRPWVLLRVLGRALGQARPGGSRHAQEALAQA